MKRGFKRVLQGYRQSRVNRSGGEVGDLMVEGYTREAWVGYLAVVPQGQEPQAPPPPPLREVLNQISIEIEELYRCRSPEGQQIPVLL